MTSAITLAESKEFIACDKVIKDAKETFHKVAIALCTIRDKRLYRAEYSSFEEYCRKAHGWAKSYGYNMAKAGDVIKSLPENSTIVENESQARELARVAPERRGQVIEEAEELAGSDPLTAAHIRTAAEILEPDEDEPEPPAPPRPVPVDPEPDVDDSDSTEAICSDYEAVMDCYRNSRYDKGRVVLCLELLIRKHRKA